MKITKTTLVLMAIFLLAFLLRLLSSAYVDIGSDEMIYSIIPYNIISAERLSTVEQAPLYFYLVDLGYNLTGTVTLISTRLPSIIFGSAAILIIFLITFEITGNKKAGVFAALLFALSGYALKFSQEMDMTAYFFSAVSIYFLIRAFKENKSWWYYASALFLALGVLAKPIVLLFLPAYVIALLWHGHHHQGLWHKQEQKIKFNPKLAKTLIGCLLLAVIVVSPVLIYNFLLYQEKGTTDYYFSVLAGVGNNQIFQGQEAESWTGTKFISVFKIVFTNLAKFDAFLLMLGIMGALITFRKEKYASLLLLASAVFLSVYLMGKMGSPTHFLWIPLILSIFAGIAVAKGMGYFSQRISARNASIILTIILLLNTLLVFTAIIPLKQQSIAITLKEYSAENIPPHAIVVLDPRIYRGIFAWAFIDKHYLEGTHFPELTRQLDAFPGTKESIPLYYLECGPGTYCGWKPEDYNRIAPFGEQLSSLFQEKMQKVEEIKAIDTFIIYRGTINAPVSIYDIIDQTHLHWYTPVGWKYPELAADYYTPQTGFAKFLNTFGLFILYADVLAALSSLVLVFVLLGKRSD